MDQVVRIHPKAHERMVHNTGLRAMELLMECVGPDFTAIEVATLLAEALGDSLAACVLHGACQSDLDEISKRKAAVYTARLAPFYSHKEQ